MTRALPFQGRERGRSALRLAPYVLRALALDARNDAPTVRHLDALAVELGAERSAVRAAVSLLHRLQLVDALRMRLTPAGLAIAAVVEAGRLPPLGWAGEASLA